MSTHLVELIITVSVEWNEFITPIRLKLAVNNSAKVLSNLPWAMLKERWAFVKSIHPQNASSHSTVPKLLHSRAQKLFKFIQYTTAQTPIDIVWCREVARIPNRRARARVEGPDTFLRCLIRGFLNFLSTLKFVFGIVKNVHFYDKFISKEIHTFAIHLSGSLIKKD